MNLMNLFKKTNTTILTQTKIEESKPLWTTNVTPGEIALAMIKSHNGYLRYLNNLYDKLYKYDDNLAGDTDVRIEALKSANYILPEGLSKQQTHFFTSFLDKFFTTLVDHTLELKLRGNLFKQIVFALENNLYTIEKFISYKNLDLRAVNHELAFYVDDEKKTLSDDKFVRIFKDSAVYESIIKYYAFFSFALNNWASFIETYGKPIRIGKYKPGSTKDEVRKLKEMIKNLGSDLGAVISDNTLIEFADFKNARANSELYDNLLNFCKKAISKRILGQTLTTNTETTGSYAQAKVHDMVRKDILQADLRDCSNYISQICSRLNRLNFSDNDIKIELSLPEHIDLSTKITIDTQLNNIIQIGPDYWYNTYNIPIPKSGAKLVTTGNARLLAGSSNTLPGGTSNDVPFLPSGIVFSQSYLNKSNKKVAKINEKYLSKLDTLDKAKDSPFPGDLYYYFGNELSKLLLASYSQQKVQTYRKTSNREGLAPVLASDSFDIDYTGNALPLVRPLRDAGSSNPLTGNAGLCAGSSNSFQINWNLTDIKALHAFRQQAFQVAGVNCENLRQMIKDQAEKAITEGITFTEFKDNLKLKGFEPDNPYHLKTNFETAINGAKSAAQWQEIQELEDIFPYLRYLTMNDDAVREEHKAWHGLVLPVNDIFWNESYPPNGYGCRCDVEQITEDEAKESKRFGDKPDPETKTDNHFKGNPGKDISIWGNWLKEQSLKSTDSSELKLPDWSTVKGTKKEPKKLEFANTDEAKDYFNDNIAGLNLDVSKYPTNIPDSLFNKINPSNQDKMNFIKPTLENPTEVWTDSNNNTNYLKKYPSGTSKIVVNIAGQVIEFDIPGESKIDKVRKGDCLKI